MLALCLILASTAKYDVSTADLLRDMWDMRTLCSYPAPHYLTRQASSYDPSSKQAGNEAWFANNDWGNFVRHEKRDGRVEHVLADVAGPGAMVRYWSPNPAGVTRIYIDGAEKPVIEASSRDLLSGKWGPFKEPMSQFTSNGWSLYCPVTFQSSLKVTVDDTDKDAGVKMYYQVQCRQYSKGVTVEPFTVQAIGQASSSLRQKLVETPQDRGNVQRLEQEIGAGSDARMTLKGSGVVTSFTVTVPGTTSTEWSDPRALHNVLRAVRVKASFDGEPCVDAPLGDLMSTPIGVNELESMPSTVSKDGTMTLRLPMPYKESAVITLHNESESPTRVKLNVATAPYDWTERSMHFKAQWKCYNGSTRPMQDLEFLKVQGAGVFVGCNVAISNPVSGWWGEGDEKMYLDGETFPSTFGTGTEDYFGYGWCDPTLFQHPYHYQSRCDGPGNKGHSCIGRWHILDRMPFSQSFQFDMELWHWVDCQIMYGRTAFWYAKPHTTPPASDSASKFPLPFIEGAVRVKGAIEGEEMKVAAKTGGENEVQGFDGLSNGKQLWWRDAKVGDKLVLNVPVAETGRYRVFGRFCHAGDYGIHRITFGDTKSHVKTFVQKSLDFFGKLGWKTVELGPAHLQKGYERFEVVVEGANPKADPRHMFGIDYLMLVREE